ncbi:MAG TPA: BatD family protein [Gemmatimonadales bacterium]|nr:BatD family protein [Gemmatimonadales bacterium]
MIAPLLLGLALALARPTTAVAAPVAAVPAVQGLRFGAAQQAAPPVVDVKLDRSRLAVGEELTMYVTAQSRSSEPLQVTLAPIDGLAIVGRSERTEITYTPTPTRTTTLEIRLRALRAGRWELGPVLARQAGDTVRAGPVAVEVTDAPAGSAVVLSPRVQRLLQHAAPAARAGQPALTILLSTDSARIGEQVDLVTVAWFPRDLRLRLRRPPVLQPPTMDGVWSYPQAAPTGVVATRRVGGVDYELFVSHQVVFPVMPGRLATSTAILKYSVPLAMQFFSQEESYQLTADPARLEVQPLPAAGRPTGFGGAVARGLTLTRSVPPGPARVGQALAVEYVLEGDGNVALWPAPDLAWPAALRAYTDRVDERTTLVNGVMHGTKRFRYLVVPDSVGTYRLPGTAYAYFDPQANTYAAAAVPPGAVAVGGGSEATARLEPPPLLVAEGPARVWELVHAVPAPVWVLLWALPPLGLVGLRLERRTRRRPAPVQPERTLEGVEAEFEGLLRSLVPDVEQRSGPGLGEALRAAGVDAPLAARVVRVREHLLARRYGPGSTDTPPPELVAEISDVLDRLGAVRRLSRRSRRVAALAVAFLAVALAALAALTASAAPARAQAPDPGRLYRSGAVREAAEAFARRAEREPAVAAHWYDLGAAFYRMGEENRAAAAWHRAHRLAPRSPTVRKALRLVPPDPASARALRVPPVTPEELLLLGTLCWLGGWAGLLLRARRARAARAARTTGRLRPARRLRRVPQDVWIGILVLGAVLGLGALMLQRWYARPLALLVADTPLRRSPYGRAESLGPLGAGTAVRLGQHVPGWLLVQATGGGPEGWVPAEALAVVQR